MIKKNGLVLLMLVLLFLFMTACSSNGVDENSGTVDNNQKAPNNQNEPQNTPQNTPQENQDPVTVKVWIRSGNWEIATYFEKYVVEPVKEKYPYITVEKIEAGKDQMAEDLVASGQIPDIFIGSTANMKFMENLDMDHDLTNLIKKYQVDLTRFEDGALDVVESIHSENKLFALPFLRHYDALYYNKDIFDKFAQDYPVDGMTWDELTDLAKPLTQMSDGIQYRGLEANIIERAVSQMKLQYVNAETGKAAVNTTEWKNFLQRMKRIYDIEGNEKMTRHAKAIQEFLGDQTLAMLPINNFLPKLKEMGGGVNWGMVSYPVFDENPGKSFGYDAHVMALAATSENKDAAFKVMSTIISDEVLMEMSKDGVFVPFKDGKYRQEFASNLNILQGKNVEAIYKTTPAEPSYQSAIWPADKAVINKGFEKEVVPGVKDINTFLREAEEVINQRLEAAQQGFEG